jgi:hypothetical protein
LHDPKGQPIETMQTIRDQVQGRVRVLLESEEWTRR